MESRGIAGVSVIVPAYNCEDTIGPCLASIVGSKLKALEIIVVDDSSTDSTASVAGEFPCRVLRLDRNYGQAHARHVGMGQSRGNVVVFVDSDILVSPDTMGRLVESLYSGPDVAAVFGILSRKHPNRGFYSQYKNLYMNYILSRCPDNVDFIYGSTFAYRKDAGPLPKAVLRIGDTELGELINRRGYRVLLDREVQVVHLKGYTFASLVRNDFSVPYHWARLFIEHRGWNRILGKRRFYHAHGGQLASLPLPYLAIASLFVSSAAAFALTVLFIGLRLDFFRFLKRERGTAFAIASVPVTWGDAAIMCLGAFAGLFAAAAKSAFGHGNQDHWPGK